MSRRHFLVELDQKIATDAVTLLLKPAQGERLVRDAGYIQGLQAAKALFEEVSRDNMRDDDQ